jgi:hypothetical protein
LEATAVLTIRLSDQHTHVVLTSRLMPVVDLADRLLSAFPSAPAS